jgi:hypothetical protein
MFHRCVCVSDVRSRRRITEDLLSFFDKPMVIRREGTCALRGSACFRGIPHFTRRRYIQNIFAKNTTVFDSRLSCVCSNWSQSSLTRPLPRETTHRPRSSSKIDTPRTFYDTPILQIENGNGWRNQILLNICETVIGEVQKDTSLCDKKKYQAFNRPLAGHFLPQAQDCSR